ncbi:hypothetical protein EOM60_02770 [Candidatus Saccharibacteria bacterium]|nr:hypothetical protein [Candidatus Saccharibacteria bacterium]
MDNEQNTAKKKGKNKAKWIFIVTIILIIGVAGAVIYYQRTKSEERLTEKSDKIVELEEKIKNLEQSKLQTRDNPTNGNGADKSVCQIPDSGKIENIIASITSKNTAALEGYMTNPVSVILAASEGMGNRTPAQAISDISGFISDADGWDFNLPQSTIDAYRGGFYVSYFPENSVIGKSNNEKVISFSFNCDASISTVFLSPGSDLLLN